MTIPDFQQLMLPLLKITEDGNNHSSREAIELLAQQFNLIESDRQEKLSSGGKKFDNRVGWASTHLKKAGLITSPKRAVICITTRGTQVLINKARS